MGTRRNHLRLLASIIGFSLSAFTAKAQNTADIVGTVMDSSDAVVAGAAVTIKNVDTKVSRSTAAGGTGDYSFTLLPVGTYSVTVEAKGFKRYAVAAVTVAAGDVKRVDARMEVGSVAQSETVVASDVAVLQTDSATVGGLLTSTAVQDLPTNGRNVITLVQMAPGANEGTQSSLGGGTRPDDRRQTSTVSANGQNDSTNNFLLDGMDNNEPYANNIIPQSQLNQIAVNYAKLYPVIGGCTSTNSIFGAELPIR